MHYGIEETGSPGTIWILCRQVPCHPSESWISSMGKNLLADVYIVKLNRLAESEVTELTSSTIKEIALNILKWHGSRGIALVCLQRKVIFDIQVNP
jgi:hypothetical protein